MSLTPGTRLGPYEIAALIGVGGMGEVYRATDTHLKRAVAIKVLPDAVAADAERTARFQREAEVLAALNHPNIAAIYGLEKSSENTALVMELVEGDTLADRLANGPIPLDDVLPIARQIAEALDAAHEQGIVHRDLKPANVKVRPDGTVKVLDFGLAKMLDPVGVSAVSTSATITSPAMTQMGMILGTAAYMSPEQARGKVADKRSDIWAFGCVLFEMLTATRAFEGDEIADVIGAVVRAEPNWSRLPADTPAALRRVLRRSLTKDRKRRLADVSDVRLELDDVTIEEPAIHDVRTPPFLRRPVVWAIGAVATLVAIAAVAALMLRTPVPEARVVRFDVAPPPGGTLITGQPLSPDGRTIAMVVNSEGKSLIWVRSLESGALRSLPGTDGATRSFWSPDSQQIAFFVEGNLKKVDLTGGRPQLLANGPFRDGAWSRSGVLLVGGQLGRALFRVSERGGDAIAETTLDTSAGEVSHEYPEFLPDGRHYLYLSRVLGRTDERTVYVGTLGSKERKALPGIKSGVRYSPTGHAVFLRANTLMAQPFDRDRLELSGDAFPIAEQVFGGRVNPFSISENGTLAFLGGLTPESELTWFDRAGRRIAPAGPVAVYQNHALSPDGRFVVFDRGSPSDVWVLDIDRAGASKITSDLADDRIAIWSPDGRTIAFTSNRGGAEGIYQRTVGTPGADTRLRQGGAAISLSDWSRDGRYLAYAAGGDIWALPLFGAREPLQVTTSPFFQQVGASFSPDGRWIAYQSDESTGVTRSGEGDIFVQSFPQRDITRQVSTAGGLAPHWSADGTELFYIAPEGTLMAVSFTARTGALDIGPPRPLITGLGPSTSPRFNVAADGRFLIRVGTSKPVVTVILNWFEQMSRGVAN